MDLPQFTTSFIAMNGHHSLAYLSALCIFYLRFAILYPIAHLLNRSYILNHPGHPLPVAISPRRNQTIHSFYLNTDMHTYITQKFPRPPQSRRWLNPQRITQEILSRWKISSPIALEGILNGPRLRQGMLVIQGGHTVYIVKEFGRVPSRDDLITTQSIALDSGNPFLLFVPISLIDIHGLHEETLHMPFQETTAFLTLINSFRALRFQRRLNNVV